MPLRYSGGLKLAVTYMPEAGEYRVIASWRDSPGTPEERERHKTVRVQQTWISHNAERDCDFAAALAIRSSPLLSAVADAHPERGVFVRRRE
jgi:hypothetical protein